MTERSTKKQKELLSYVDGFIKEHGYGPSYREVMNGLGYKSVSTVAVHIDGLISKGYLHKRDNSARSLEVVSSDYKPGAGPSTVVGGTAKEKWLVEAVEERFTRYGQSPSPQLLDELYVLIGALKVLGFEGAYEAMRSKLAQQAKR
jgi:SOS-response transcriptional repressors (RecA-mediated autopeptidases)